MGYLRNKLQSSCTIKTTYDNVYDLDIKYYLEELVATDEICEEKENLSTSRSSFFQIEYFFPTLMPLWTKVAH